MSPRALSASAGLALLLAAVPASATPIIIPGANTRSHALAYDAAVADPFQAGFVSPTGLGTGSDTRTSGSVTTTTAYAYTANGGDITLAHTFDQSIPSGGPASTSGPFNYEEVAQSFGGIEFALEAGDIGYTYALDGRMEQDGTSRLRLQASLLDMTTGMNILFVGGEHIVSTDAVLQTGESGMTIGGSLGGDLVAGHTYRLTYSSFIQHWSIGEGAYTNPNGFIPTDAQGHLTLTLSGPAPLAAVPEPATLALLGLGLGLLAFASRRRK